MSGAAWTIPVRRSRKPAPGRPKPPTSSPSKPRTSHRQPPRPAKDWDFTVSDHDKYKLSPLEQEWRRAQRVSKNRVPRLCSQQWAGCYPLDQEDEYLLDSALYSQPHQHPAAFQLVGGHPEEDSDTDSTEAPSITDMQQFIQTMQTKYSISPAKPPTAAQQKLAQLRREQRQAAAAGAAEQAGDGSGSDADSCVASVAQQQRLAWLQQDGLGGRLTSMEHDQPNILSCRSRSPVAASFTTAPCSAPAAAEASEVAALAGRLAAAEAKLERFKAMQGELAQARQQVDELKAQQQALQSEMNDYVSHTSTLLTSLQTTLAGLLARSERSSSMQTTVEHPAAEQPETLGSYSARSSAPPPIPPITAAFQAFQIRQQQAAASQVAALGEALQAVHPTAGPLSRCQDAAATAPLNPSRQQAASANTQHAAQVQPSEAAAPAAVDLEERPSGPLHLNSPQPSGDVLAEVQLPSYSQRFAVLSRPADRVHNQAGSAGLSLPAGLKERAAAAAAAMLRPQRAAVTESNCGRGRQAEQCGWSSRQGGGSENCSPAGSSVPLPRALPAAVLATACRAGSPAASSTSLTSDFEWRPCSASS